MHEKLTHEFEPVFDIFSEILILGTFPSVKSRENGFYYSHPQNRFWQVLSTLLGCVTPCSIEEKKSMLLKNKIAIWDVITSCDIIGSSDSSIKNVVPIDINRILTNSHITKIYANGNMAKKLYDRYLKQATGIEIVSLPSTSPANAAYSLERLIIEWKWIKK